jgi:hypothetical protein
MAKDSPATQKELSEVTRELSKAIGGLREQIEKRLELHDKSLLATAKLVDAHGVQLTKLEEYIKKVDKENWL